MNLRCTDLAKAAGLKFGRKLGQQLFFHCPNHQDSRASLCIHIDKNVWMCGPCNESGGAWALSFFLSKLNKTHEVLDWLVDRGLVEERSRTKSKLVSTYTYRDPDGKEYLQVKKFLHTDGKKSYAQYHWDESKNDWVSGSAGIKLYPYRINEWQGLSACYCVEGEKDADNLWRWNIPATTNPMGAGSWKEEFNEYFRGKKVVILPDNDEPGKKHGQTILANLIPVAVGVKLVHLPDLPPKGDLSDWIAKCQGTKEKLAAIVRATPWATLADAGICEDPTQEAKILVRRINHDIADLFETVAPDYDKAWYFMKDNEQLWTRIKEKENKLDESCRDGDPFEIVQARCMEWKIAWKEAIEQFLKEVVNKKR